MNPEKKRIYQDYLRRESDFIRADYQQEFAFYRAVKQGDVERVGVLLQDLFSDKEGWGKLSDDPLQNLKYHFTVTAAMLARHCIEGGMKLSDSYSLSDYYIHTADEAGSESEITGLHREMCLDYTKKMRSLRKKKLTSMPVAKAVDYIYDHLHTRITLEALAEYVGRNPSYLSRIFKEETGVTVGRYIRMQKLEAAANMLLYSEFGASAVSSILAFPSQSYFTEVFRKEYGVTPLEYRKQNLFAMRLGNEDIETKEK